MLTMTTDDADDLKAAGRPQDFVWCLCDAWKEKISRNPEHVRDLAMTSAKFNTDPKIFRRLTVDLPSVLALHV